MADTAKPTFWSVAGQIVGWTIGLGFLWLLVWRPIQDAPEWGKALGGAVVGLGVYIVVTLEALKKQLSSIGELTWRVYDGRHHSDH